MDPIASPVVIFIFVFVMYIVFKLGRPGYTPGSGAIMLEPEEFARLLAKEEQSLVFCYPTGFGGIFYLTNVKGNKICTKTGSLELPEQCELVKLKKF